MDENLKCQLKKITIKNIFALFSSAFCSTKNLLLMAATLSLLSLIALAYNLRIFWESKKRNLKLINVQRISTIVAKSNTQDVSGISHNLWTNVCVCVYSGER